MLFHVVDIHSVPYGREVKRNMAKKKDENLFEKAGEGLKGLKGVAEKGGEAVRNLVGDDKKEKEMYRRRRTTSKRETNEKDS
jgi:hypothetical protein